MKDLKLASLLFCTYTLGVVCVCEFLLLLIFSLLFWIRQKWWGNETKMLRNYENVIRWASGNLKCILKREEKKINNETISYTFSVKWKSFCMQFCCCHFSLLFHCFFAEHFIVVCCRWLFFSFVVVIILGWFVHAFFASALLIKLLCFYNKWIDMAWPRKR